MWDDVLNQSAEKNAYVYFMSLIENKIKENRKD